MERKSHPVARHRSSESRKTQVDAAGRRSARAPGRCELVLGQPQTARSRTAADRGPTIAGHQTTIGTLPAAATRPDIGACRRAAPDATDSRRDLPSPEAALVVDRRDHAVRAAMRGGDDLHARPQRDELSRVVTKRRSATTPTPGPHQKHAPRPRTSTIDPAKVSSRPRTSASRRRHCSGCAAPEITTIVGASDAPEQRDLIVQRRREPAARLSRRAQRSCTCATKRASAGDEGGSVAVAALVAGTASALRRSRARAHGSCARAAEARGYTEVAARPRGRARAPRTRRSRSRRPRRPAAAATCRSGPGSRWPRARSARRRAYIRSTRAKPAQPSVFHVASASSCARSVTSGGRSAGQTKRVRPIS